MAFNLRNRSLLTVQDFTQREFHYLLDLARDLKRAKYAGTEQQHLKGKEIVLIFEKASTRTRCAFEVACHDQGAHVTYLDPSGSQIGHKESVKDTARVLGRMYDAIEFRGYSQEAVEDLAKYAGVPVFNGLTDEYHPTQMVADVMTMRENSDKPLHEIKYAYVGDTRSNMGHSLMIVGCLLGMDVRICGPKSLWPSDDYVKIARDLEGKIRRQADHHRRRQEGRGRASTSSTPTSGSRWARRRKSGRERIKLLKPYQVNLDLMKATGNPRAKFMHCLPAFHNLETKVGRDIHEQFGLTAMEVTEEVFESETEHRLRAGRKPHAHDQGDPRRGAGGLRPCASSWPSAAMRCCGAASR